MDSEKREKVLLELYENMKVSYMDSCFGMNSSSYDEATRTSLDEAGKLGLTWKDFYEVHEDKGVGYKVEQISKLKKDGLEVRIIKDDNGEMRLRFSGDTSLVVPGLTFEKFYEENMAREIREIENRRIDKKFPEDKKIERADFNKVSSYFSGDFFW